MKHQKTILLISPHLDDAVFSVGGLMAALADEGHNLHIVTCFTQSVPNPTGFALACQLDKGLSAEVDYMELRRAEDAQACQLLGAHPRWLDLPEAPHRGYESAPALFDSIVSTDTVQDELLARLPAVVAELSPDLVLSPVGIGHHVDHQQVRRAVETLQEHFQEVPFLYWYDEPYLSRNPSEHPDKVKEGVPSWATLVKQVDDTTVMSLDIKPYWDRKIAACAAYTTQVGFQFGGPGSIGAGLEKMSGQKRFTELVI